MGSGCISFQSIYIMYEGIQCNVNTGIYKGPFESISFYFRKYKVMTPFSKDPITFGGSKLYNT